MSTDPQTLTSQSACYVCFGVSVSQAFTLALLAQIANGGNTPTTGDVRITEEGNRRITESGDTRITQ